MGTSYQFKCGDCGYTAEVCGGKDRGMIAVVQTMICQDCLDVVDVVIEQMVDGVPICVLALDDDWDSCPQCDSKKVVVWDESRPCPRCDGQMAQDDSVVTVTLWD